jgi:glucosyl-3-phosphoglycerate synthase
MSAIAAEDWAQARTFHHSRYTAEVLAAERGPGGTAAGTDAFASGSPLSVSICLPARDCAATVGEIVAALVPLVAAGVIDEIVVIDASSADGTAAIAERAGATVYQEAELLPQFGPVLGKGDAMWRALSVLRGELVCFLDADSEGFEPHFATGLLGPLIADPEIAFVKAYYRRPFEQHGISLPEGGGRVNHLMARPALALFYPELAQVRQPLAGEVAARRSLLERLPFATGYGVEIAMLIDVWREVGLEGIAQVDLGVHHNHHQPLQALSPMASTVLATVARRLEREGRLSGVELAVDSAIDGRTAVAAPVERPALASLSIARV